MPDSSRDHVADGGRDEGAGVGSGWAVLLAHPGAELYGADRVMLETVDALVERGAAVTVTIPDDGPLVAEIERRGARVVRCRTPVLRKRYLKGVGPLLLAAAALRSVVPSIRLLRSLRPQALYVSTITIPFWLALGWAARVPVVCHVHEAEASASRFVRVLLACPLLFARRILVNSRFSTDVVAGAIPRLGRRCRVVYNGVAGPPEVVPPRETLDGGVRLLYVGRLSERKGVIDAVEAVSHLRTGGLPASLDLVGAVFPGYEWVEDQLRERVATLGLEDKVDLRGFDPDIWGHLARADVLLVPSRIDEPFGNTAVEGALAGRPVIATRSGGLIEAVEGLAASRTVRVGDPGAIARAVQDVVEEWKRVRSDAIADADRARTRFSPATYREAVAGEIESVRR